MIDHETFKKLRLESFVPKNELSPLGGWEFEDRMWVGESYGFSEWLRPEEKTEDTEYISIHIPDFADEQTESISSQLDIRIEEEIEIKDLVSRYGEPSRTFEFTDDRKTFEFDVYGENPYTLSFTILNEGGLVLFGMMLKNKTREPVDSYNFGKRPPPSPRTTQNKDPRHGGKA